MGGNNVGTFSTKGDNKANAIKTRKLVLQWVMYNLILNCVLKHRESVLSQKISKIYNVLQIYQIIIDYFLSQHHKISKCEIVKIQKNLINCNFF